MEQDKPRAIYDDHDTYHHLIAAMQIHDLTPYWDHGMRKGKEEDDRMMQEDGGDLDVV